MCATQSFQGYPSSRELGVMDGTNHMMWRPQVHPNEARMFKPLFAVLVVSGLALLEPLPAAAAPAEYTISEITVPGSQRTLVSALNESGQIAGSYFSHFGGSWAPYFYHQGSFTFPDNF